METGTNGNTGEKGLLAKEVVLKLTGEGKSFGLPEGVEIVYPGEYYYKNGNHYVLYEESSDEAGTVMDTRCILKMRQGRLEMIKHGAVSTNMVFEPGNPNVSIYRTPFGELSVGTAVRGLDVTEEEHLIKADLLYTVEINNDYAEECHLTLTVTD